MRNLYKAFIDLFPKAPRQFGTVGSVDTGLATIHMPGGGIATALGDASPGDTVFFRDGVIEGPAPDLELTDIQV